MYDKQKASPLFSLSDNTIAGCSIEQWHYAPQKKEEEKKEEEEKEEEEEETMHHSGVLLPPGSILPLSVSETPPSR